MILREEVIEVGCLLKPHGINGEITVDSYYDIDLAELRCLVIDIDAIMVPFFIESVRPKGSSSLIVKLEGINNEKQAATLSGKEAFALRNDLDIEAEEEGEGFGAYHFVDYTVVDGTNNATIGRIADIDDTTDNWLFVIEKADDKDTTFYIPVADEFITAIDEEKRILTMELPQGLLEL